MALSFLLLGSVAVGAGLHARMVAIGSVEHDPVSGVVRGEITNVSESTLRDVRLRVLVNWLWNDERNPGTDDQSWGAMVTVPGPLGPGDRLPFQARRPTSSSLRDDGRFQIRVRVAGLRRTTEVRSAP